MLAYWSSTKALSSTNFSAAHIIPNPSSFIFQFPSMKARTLTSNNIGSVAVTSESISDNIYSSATAAVAAAAAAAAARKTRKNNCLSEFHHMYLLRTTHHQYFSLKYAEDLIMSLLSYRWGMVKCILTISDLTSGGMGARLGVTDQGYGRVYRPPIALDSGNNNNNIKYDTKTKEVGAH